MDLPYFERASRRTFLRRGLAATGVVATGGFLAACSKSDQAIFSSATTAAPIDTSSPTTAAPVTSTANDQATSPSSAPAASDATGGAAVTDISFTYTAADAGGRVRNPYVAVWVEDGSGQMVALLGVWYSARDVRYLSELTEFASAADNVTSDQLDAVSGATRSAGEYQVQWDGTGLDGTPLTGDHAVWIEAAREHGPHSVTSGTVTLGKPGSTTITGDGELSDAAVTIA